MRYEWFVAKRYLRPQGGATFIFHLTLISMGGVALGVASLIVVLSVMNGFGNYLRSIILEVRSHLVMEYPSGTDRYEELLTRFVEHPNVEAASPAIFDYGFLFTSTQAKSAVVVIGVDPNLESRVTYLDEHLVVGSLDDLTTPRPVANLDEPLDITQLDQLDATQRYGLFIGSELAKGLYPGFYEAAGEYNENSFRHLIGQRVTLYAVPLQETSPSLSAFNSIHFEIKGVFETGHYEYDSSMVYISIPAAQHLYNLGGMVERIQLRLRDHGRSATIATARDIYSLNSDIAGYGFARTWMELNQVFFNALEIEKMTMDIILRIIILVATFNIIATLFMVVTEKTRDIGLLRALGAGRVNIMFIFMGLGVLIGAMGALTGAGVGYIICTFIQIYPIEMPGGGSIYYLQHLPCDMEARDFLWVTLYTFIVSFLASIYPAIRASRAVIVEALRFS